MTEMFKNWDDVSRRAFVTHAAQAFLGVSALTPVANRATAAPLASTGGGGKAKNCIYLFMNGGMSHLETFDPGKDSEVAGPVQPIKTNVAGIQLSEYMPKLAQQMDKCALVRSLTSVNGAHERGRYVMRTSFAPLATLTHPAMGAWVSKFMGKRGTLPANVLISGEADHPAQGYLEPSHAPIRIGNPYAGLQDSKLPAGVDQQQFARRLALSDRLDQNFRKRYNYDNVSAYNDFYADAIKLMRSEDLEAFELGKEKDELRQRYGMNHFGQGCLLARRLIENGVRYVEVNHGGWDHHTDIFDTMPGRAGTIDQGIAALLEDLQSRGLLKDTIVVVATEFGRTPKINDGLGRDHHPRVFSGLLAGGGIQGGQVYGKSDNRGHAPAEDPVELPDYNATIGYALGLPLDKRIFAKSGRPFMIADEGKPLKNLF